MKKSYIFSILFFIGFAVSGQTYLTEDFSSNLMPPAGWSIDGMPGQWMISNTDNAGGIAPEGLFTYEDTVTYTRLISPAIDLTGLTTVALIFNHYYSFYDNPAPVFGVATRSGGGSWTSVWQVAPAGDVGPELKVLDITSSDVGQADFQLCFYINGDLYNMNYWFLDDIMLFTPLSLDLALKAISLPEYILVNNNVTLTGTVLNWGSSDITSLEVAYRVDGGPAQISSITGVTIPFAGSYDFTHSVPLSFSTAGGYHTINVNIQDVNNGTDLNPDNDSSSAAIGVVPWAPEKKVFCEEATGTWCGFCVRGICFMNYMEQTYPESWIGVAVHNDDPMVYAPWDDEIPNIIPNFPGYPSGTLDRAGSDYTDPSDFEEAYLERITKISPVSVDIENFTWDTATRVVGFDVICQFSIDMPGEMRFAAAILEDSVWGTGSGYIQSNYYSGGNLGPMCGFESLPDHIPAASMHYDHVGRVILDSPYGTPSSIQGPITSGSSFSYHYTYTIPNNWRFDKLEFVGLVLNNTSGEILNANSIDFMVGMEEMNKGAVLSVYPNPASDLFNLMITLDKGQNTMLTVRDFLGRIVFNEKQAYCPAGTLSLQIDTRDYPAGLYFVELKVDNKAISKKIAISR
jgi:hypothetical protein